MGKRDIFNQIVSYSIPVTNNYSNRKGPQLGQKALFFAKWWGNPKGLLEQMPHYATVFAAHIIIRNIFVLISFHAAPPCIISSIYLT